MAAQTAVDESDAAGVADAIVDLQAARAAEEVAEAEAMAAAEIATAAEADVATAQAAVDAADTGPASETLTEQARKAAIAGARKAFILLDSIPREGVEASPPAPAVIALPLREMDTKLTVSHSGEAVKFSAPTTADTTDRADETTNRPTTAFSQADANMAPAIPGLYSATLTGKKAGNNATGIVYSNIEAPKDKLFAVQYEKVVPFGTAGLTDEGTGANAHWGRSKIPPANKYTGGVSGGSIQGSYRGVEGAFTCKMEGCPGSDAFPERRSDGTVIATEETDPAILGSMWSFKPTDEAAMVKVADSDHLSFGYWLSKNTAGNPVGFGVWYEGSADVATSGEIDTLDEKVTYTGAAAGKYVVKSDVPNAAHAGYFTASATLTADFTDEAHATDEPGTVKGTISSFKDGDSAPLGDLKLSLSGNLAYDTTANTLNVENLTGVKAESGGRKHVDSVGGWEAQFFGKDKTTNIPTGVAGAFNATIAEQAVVVGGFGATK